MITAEQLKIAAKQYTICMTRAQALSSWAPAVTFQDALDMCFCMEVHIQFQSLCACLGVEVETMLELTANEADLEQNLAQAATTNASTKAQAWDCSDDVAAETVSLCADQYLALQSLSYGMFEQASVTSAVALSSLRLRLPSLEVNCAKTAALVSEQQDLATAQRLYLANSAKLTEAIGRRACQMLGFDLESLSLILDSDPEDLQTRVMETATAAARRRKVHSMVLFRAFITYSYNLCQSAELVYENAHKAVLN